MKSQKNHCCYTSWQSLTPTIFWVLGSHICFINPSNKRFLIHFNLSVLLLVSWEESFHRCLGRHFFRVVILWFRRSIPNELVFLYTMIQLFEKYFKFCLSFTPSRLEHKNSICYYSLLVKNNNKPVDQPRRNVCLECSSGLRSETLAWNDKALILISSMGRRDRESNGGMEGQKERRRVREKTKEKGRGEMGEG